ncbi:hypothetical protein SAMN05216249_11373 [Acetitomaculum ruminis DSM 5522]|uniref:Pre-peptidase C-terminal domain-containing protein n=1 Tax=Acetitomaculum ruminis DSM 5522 TaxID=1120918 RepID=A0A1I0Z812_9FIRM|nr:hypothetical protein [Acetitomaculum ruminis]SFB21552.1 hypothetical protein SAMN05216249_11373 [Acetitomaculum ruminis DSM 5522]
MKNIKQLLTILLLVTVLFLSPIATNTVNAVSDTPFNHVVNLHTKGTYTKTWDKNSFDNHCFVKFTMKKNGYVDISVTNPVASDGTSKFFDMYIYKEKKSNEVWGHNVNELYLTSLKRQTKRVGLRKGVYVLEIVPNTWITGTDENLKSKITITTKSCSNYERESNGTRQKANILTMGKATSGTYGDEAYFAKNQYADWYKIKLQKGKKYKITYSRPRNSLKSTTLINVLASNQIYDFDYGSKLRKNGSVTLTAKRSGYYYIQIYNYGNQKAFNYKIKVEKKK